MPIKYALFENNLTTDPNDHAAQVQISATIGPDEIADIMAQQGSTTTKADILAVLEDAEQAVVTALKQGNRVHLGGLGDFFPRVVGVFISAADTFDPARHRVDVAVNPGVRVRSEVKAQATVEKVDAVPPEPTLLEYVDLGSGTTNQTITPGNIGTINGSRLQYNTAQADEGIFYLPTGGGAAINVPDANVQKNKPGQLVYLTPPAGLGFPPGTYFLEVRARVDGGVQLRTGRLDDTLTVV